jgi:hypothetical protein
MKSEDLQDEVTAAHSSYLAALQECATAKAAYQEASSAETAAANRHREAMRLAQDLKTRYDALEAKLRRAAGLDIRRPRAGDEQMQ